MMDTSELVNRLDHDEAMQLQAVELERTLELLRSLDDADWSAQTDCPEWDVHHMYLHVLGACEAAASMKENLHQMRAAKRQQKAVGGPLEAGLSAVQVRERLDIGPAQLVERLAVVAPVAVRKRTRMPELVRRVKLKVDGPVVERWPLGYLVDTIYLRDLWMHRVDACRATGREMVVTPGHDGRIIGDVVDEWAERHGRPYHLFFSGPPDLGSLGASSTGADDGGSAEPEPIEIDAVEFCRTLAGRAEGSGLLTTIVPF